MCCTAGHIAIWQKIANGADNVGVVLEHDAIMLQPITIEIPENTIVVLGYKLNDPSRYDHVAAGVPNELIRLDGHEGAHAYAMTKRTAKFLVDELHTQGLRSAVDNDYFIRGQRRTAMPLHIASPTPAMGWLRESTIWGVSANKNYDFIPSFLKNYK
jgi:GR25 family glycosyltransferase involved in LPS biosynthesis